MLLGLTGTLGAGKGAVVAYLVKQKGFRHVSVSDFLTEEVRRRGKVVDRVALRDMANEFRVEGSTTLMEAVLAAAGTKSKNMIVESQHTPAEVRFVQKKGGKVIAVDAELNARYERIQKRGSLKDNVSFEEFATQQKEELAADDPNKNNLGAAIAAADFHVMNNGSVEELHQQIDSILISIAN